jgi:hypothetical protein
MVMPNATIMRLSLKRMVENSSKIKERCPRPCSTEKLPVEDSSGCHEIAEIILVSKVNNIMVLHE